MGYAIEWQAFRGKLAQAVCDDLGLNRTGSREDVAESPLVGVDLPGGWYVVVADNFSRYGRNVSTEQLSNGCEVVVCRVEEHVGYSSAEGWTDGRQIWSIVHDPTGGDLKHLETKGNLPAGFDAIRDGQRAKQEAAGGKKAKVDYYFDIPIEVAKAITGFCHNEGPVGTGKEPFEVLEPVGSAKRGRVAQKLFGVTMVFLLFCGLPLAIGVLFMLVLYLWSYFKSVITGR